MAIYNDGKHNSGKEETTISPKSKNLIKMGKKLPFSFRGVEYATIEEAMTVRKDTLTAEGKVHLI